MRFTFDHDLHIHSYISSCSKDPEQTNENILKYAKKQNLKTICLANHFWDENIEGASNWYSKQDFAHISAAKPLPEDDSVRFLFGCETEINKDLTLALSPERYDEFDFIIIPTTHFHMQIALYDEQRKSAEALAQAWIDKLDAVLNMDLPFYKVGIAHLACHLIANDKISRKKILNTIPETELIRLFTKAASLNVGIELNGTDMTLSEEDADSVLRIFRIAKDCGCKFYIGSDAHSQENFKNCFDVYNKAIDVLDLKECDKFDLVKL